MRFIDGAGAKQVIGLRAKGDPINRAAQSLQRGLKPDLGGGDRLSPWSRREHPELRFDSLLEDGHLERNAVAAQQSSSVRAPRRRCFVVFIRRWRPA